MNSQLKPARARFSLLEPVIAAFVGLILVSNVIAQKFFDVHFLGLTFSCDVGTILLFPLTYIFSDVLTEVFGYATSRRVVWYGFGMNALAALVFQAAILFPHSEYFTIQAAFASVLGNFTSVAIASLAGYWFGSFTNDSVIAALKVWMVKWDPKHRYLAVRTIASTIVGELVDTTIFVAVASALGVFPWEQYLSLVFTQWLIKTLVEVLLTPLTIVVIRLMKKHERVDMVGTDSWNPFAFRHGGGVNLLGKDRVS